MYYCTGIFLNGAKFTYCWQDNWTAKKNKKNPTKTKQNQTIVGLFFWTQKNKPTNFWEPE